MHAACHIKRIKTMIVLTRSLIITTSIYEDSKDSTKKQLQDLVEPQSVSRGIATFPLASAAAHGPHGPRGPVVET